jgi:hypothetical protein
MFFLVNSTPNDIPADVIAAEIEARRMEEEFPEKEKVTGSHVREVWGVSVAEVVFWISYVSVGKVVTSFGVLDGCMLYAWYHYIFLMSWSQLLIRPYLFRYQIPREAWVW